MSLRESECSSRRTILGSTIGRIVPKRSRREPKTLMFNHLRDKGRCARMSRMRWLAACAAILAASPLHAADDPLLRARALYNQKQFEAAVAAAEQARAVPSRADAADLVAARADLERYRLSSASHDLTNARDRPRRIHPPRLSAPERAENVVGLRANPV